MSYLDWKVDDKVVCVDHEWRDENLGAFVCPLEMGRVYTIAAITTAIGTYRGRADHITVCLKEVRNPYETLGGASGFAAARFRPVQTRKTSIAIFERIRDNPKAPIIEPSPKQRERV